MGGRRGDAYLASDIKVVLALEQHNEDSDYSGEGDEAGCVEDGGLVYVGCKPLVVPKEGGDEHGEGWGSS